MNQAELLTVQALTVKYFSVAPSKQNFTPDEIALLKRYGIIRKSSRKMSDSEAEIAGAAYTALAR
jgi:hypothetical protein